MKNYGRFLLILMICAVIVPNIPGTNAHPPDDLELEYNYEEQKLYVTITHGVGNPNTHYIERVEVTRNDVEVIAEDYSSQPDDTQFTYVYEITAEDGDELEVYARCNQFGDRTESITVDAPDKDMDVEIEPDIESVDEGDSQKFNVTVTSEGSGVEGVDLDIKEDHGSISGLMELGEGSYEFTYEAEGDAGGEDETLNITASKDGYSDAFAEEMFSINEVTVPPKDMDIAMEPSIESLEENGIQSFNVTITSEETGVEGVTLEVVENHGSISDLTEHGNGNYSFRYQAGTDAGGFREVINITSSKEGYNEAYLEVMFDIIEDDEPDQGMTLSIDPEIETIEAGASQTFTINITENGTGVEGVELDITEDHGGTTDPVETGTGDYEFTYTAREDRDGETEVLNITAEKNGYEDAFLELSFTITAKPNGTMVLAISPTLDSMNLSASQIFTVNITSEGESVAGVELDIDADEGSITNISEDDGGRYSFTYTAPEGEPDETETIRIRAEKEGYDDAEIEVSFILEEVPVQPVIPTLDGVVEDDEYLFSTEFGDGELIVHWSINDTTLKMALIGDSTGWISIGFEPSQAMEDADMIIGWVDDEGTVFVIDAFSTGRTGPHPADTTLGGTDDIMEMGGVESEGKTAIEFTRLLDTGDRYDKVIPNEGRVNMIWAVGSSDNFNSAHSRTTRGTGTITVESGESTEEDEVELWPIHAFFMTLGFLSMLAAIYIAMFRKTETWWLKYHRIVGLFGALATVIGLAMGMYMVEDSTGEHFRVGHAYMGLITIILAILTPVMGFLMFKLKKQMKTIKEVHHWLGRITILFMILAILGGLGEAGVI